MTSIEKYLHEFEACFNGDLNTEEKKAFEKSLMVVQQKNDAWKEYRSMMEAFSRKEAISLRLLLNKIYQSRQHGGKVLNLTSHLWFRISAAAVVIVALGCLLYLFVTDSFNFRSTNEILITQTDTTNVIQYHINKDTITQDGDSIPGIRIQESQSGVQLASLFEKEEYQISPEFAELLHNVYRGDWFGLTNPEDSVLCLTGDSLSFSWKTNIQKPLYFDVLDRHGKVFYKYPKSISSPWTYKPKLPPAIYMYRFATENHPVWMGVVVVIQGEYE